MTLRPLEEKVWTLLDVFEYFCILSFICALFTAYSFCKTYIKKKFTKAGGSDIKKYTIPVQNKGIDV